MITHATDYLQLLQEQGKNAMLIFHSSKLGIIFGPSGMSVGGHKM